MKVTKKEIIGKMKKRLFEKTYDVELFGVKFMFVKFHGEYKYQIRAELDKSSNGSTQLVLSYGAGTTKQDCVDLLYEGINNLFPDGYFTRTVQNLIK